MSPPETRSARKRRAILSAATVVFLREGYASTTMDQVAALAEVSKLTIYRHFADKSTLFTEVVTSTVDHASNVVQQEILALGRTVDLEADLRALARRQLGLVMQPHLLRLRRLVIAELARFPALGRIFYDRGPDARSSPSRRSSTNSPPTACSAPKTHTWQRPNSTGS